MYIDYHYGGLPGRPAGPAATRPIGLTDACMNDNNNNNNNNDGRNINRTNRNKNANYPYIK